MEQVKYKFGASMCNEAEGCLYLPYVKDEKIINLEKSVETWMRSYDSVTAVKRKLEEKLAYAELPFYKRWFADKPA